MIDIAVGDIYSSVLKPLEHGPVLAIIREAVRARPEGYKFMPKYKAGYWDGYISLMSGVNKFPTGLLGYVLGILSEKKVKVTVHHPDLETVNSIDSLSLQGITLRDYQVEAANTLVSTHRGIAKMATNSGKTEVMAAIIKAIGGKTIVLLHRKELMYQTAERFRMRGLSDVGIIGDGVWEPNKITVAMIQTLSNRLSDLRISDTRVLMVDECHHVSSNQALDVILQIPGPFRYGFSGTPLKYDDLADMKLIGATGPVVYEINNEDLINMGHSAKPVIHIHIVEDRKPKVWEMEYEEAYSEMIVKNVSRNRFLAKWAIGRAREGAVLILVERLEHGKVIRQMINGSVFVTGEDTTVYRNEVLREMRAGKGVFIATPIFDEGVDVPNVNSIILAGGGANMTKLLQRIGRGLRKKMDGSNLQVLDFIDDTNQYLLAHSRSRIEVYSNEGFDTQLI